MMKKWRSQQGFTLIELVMVIVILGILASVAVPKFQDLSIQAKEAATEGVIGGVRSAIGIYFASNLGAAFPTKLDDNAGQTCSQNNAFFDSVLAQGGITDPSWSQGALGVYTGPNTDVYTYYPDGDANEGAFIKTTDNTP